MNILKIGIGVILVESVTAQLSVVTEAGNTGQRLTTATAANHGNIGSNAIDLSVQPDISETKGATGLASTAMGYSTTAEGSHATAMGYSTIASDYASVSIGQYNLAGSTVTSSATVFSGDNTAFVIGMGTEQVRADAFKVNFWGDTEVAGKLTVGDSLVIGGQVLTDTDVEQLKNILNQLAGTDEERKECLRYAWKTFATC